MSARFPHIPVDFPRMIDLSNVRTDSSIADIDLSIAAAKKYRFKCVFAMPVFTPYLIEQMRGCDDVLVGGTTGFPSGEDTTATKVFAARELAAMGCGEIDMVIAVGAVKSGRWDMVRSDIQAVRDAVPDRPLKTILEVSLLTRDEIKRAAVTAVECGADYVKTGTGWMPKPVTVEDIVAIREAIGDSAFIKAAGGIATLEQADALIAAGCSRFGISYAKTMKLMRDWEEDMKE